MASKARLKKVADRIIQLEHMRSNPNLREAAEKEIETICFKYKLSLEEMFEVDELVLKELKKSKK